MDPTLRAVCFLVAIIMFILDAVLHRGVSLFTAIGLAFFAAPFAWDAFELA